MKMPARLACKATEANTLSLITRVKVEKPHPVTGKMLVVSPTLFIHFPGTRSIFIGDAEAKVYGFADLTGFWRWLRKRGEVEKGEIIYSATLDVPLKPVAELGRVEVLEELRRRMLLGEKDEVPVSPEDMAAALLELRAVAGESVVEPRPKPPEEQPVGAAAGDEAARLTDGILGKYATGR